MTGEMEAVVVVGAGPVGLITALKLAQAGVPVRVLEAGPAINDQPRALVYHTHTVAALDQLGVLTDMLRIGLTKQNTQWRALDGHLLGNIDLALLEPGETPYPYHLHLGQHRLAGVVLDHLMRLPNTRVDFGCRVTGVTQTDAAVTVATETAGEASEIRARWVVGADGAGSTVRRALGLQFDGETWPEWFVATDMPYDFERFGWAVTTFVVDPVHWAVIPKIADGLWRLTYGEPGDLPREALRGRVAAKYEAILPGGAAVEPVAFSPYRVHDRCADRFRVGRVLLAGDAAHAVNPIGGLGLTNGVLDAMALGDALAGVIGDQAGDEALDRYAEERRRIFLDFASPMARENKRWISETDPEKRKADAARFASFSGSIDVARGSMQSTANLVSKPVVSSAAGLTSMSDQYATYPSLRGRNVLVTGGASGIGASIVEHFAAQGSRVGFLDLDARAAGTLLAGLPADQIARFRQVDLRDIAALQAAIRALEAELGGPFAVLVNNAARDDRHAIDEVTPDYWDDRMNTNLRHQFFCIQAVRPGMVAAGGGSVVNMSSNAFLTGSPGMPAYMTAKAGVVGLTRGLARDLGRDRIRINAVYPGWIMTERQLTLWMDEAGEIRRRNAQSIPDRLYPPDVARMVLWLAADDSKLVTARDFIVDGGRL